MENLFGFVEAFYSRFILRDLLAKIVPGSFLLIYISRFFNENIILNEISFIFGIFLISVSWIIGFAIQGFGERLDLIKYHKDKEAEARYKKFIGLNLKDNQKDVERIVVIKETCGNSYVSLTLVFILYIIEVLINKEFTQITNLFIRNIPLILSYLLIVFSLRYMHFKHIERQDSLIASFLDGI
jgi:hypothetical protein